jgi:hypothetical protein
MKTKAIAVLVVLSSYFCAASYSQSSEGLRGGSNTGNSQPTTPVNNGNNNTVAQPTPAASPSVFSNSTLNGVVNEVRKTKEYQAFEKQVMAKVNNSKVGKKASSFKRFLQRIGLAKKTVVPRKAS